MITASPGVIIAGAAGALLVVLAARRLPASGGGYRLLAGIATGVLTGPILLAWLSTRTCRPIVVTPFARRGLAGLVLASITALPAALAALVCYGAGTSTGNAAFAAVIQPHVPDGIRGRVFSGSGLIWQPMRLGSVLLGGLLAATAGIRAVYLGDALLAAAAPAGPILR